MTIPKPPASGGVIPPNDLPPVPDWIEHDSWLAVRRQLKEDDPELLARFNREFGFTGSPRPDREILTEVLPVSASETPYRPPITTDAHLDDEMEQYARKVAELLEREIKQRLSIDD
jgi:hypothetical protein